MSFLIDAFQYRKLLEHEKVTHLYRSKDFVEGFTYGVETAISHLTYMPNLDTVQVRCKDCCFGCKLKDSELYKKSPYKYFKENSILCNCMEWGEDPTVVDPNGYCYFGAQNENDDACTKTENDRLTIDEMKKLNGDPIHIDIGPGVYGLCFGNQDIVVLGDNQSISIETASTCNPRLVSNRETL